jgi:ABC-type sugar transport system ATPase subunit
VRPDEDLVERLGNETVVSFQFADGMPWLAVLDSDVEALRGDPVSFDIKPGHALVFDADGRCIGLPRA